MDKKNLFIGVLLLVAAFAIVYLGPKNAPKQQPQPAAPVPAAHAPAITDPGAPAPVVAQGQNATFAALASENGKAEHVTLSNDYIEARFTNYGGAIEDIAFKKYPAQKKGEAPFVFNAKHADPIFAFTTNEYTARKLDRQVPYTLVSSTATEVVYRTIFENRIEVTRTYRIVPSGAPPEAGDPYHIRHEVVFRNLTGQSAPMPAMSMNIGTASPVNERDSGVYLTSGYNNGDDSEFVERSALAGGSGFLGMGASSPVPYIESPGKIVWASVSNQFFTGILSPDAPGRGILTRRVEMPPLPGMTVPAVGLTVVTNFAVPALAPNGETKLGFNYYAGPKEYTRLANKKNFPNAEAEVMQYGRYFFNRIMFSGAIAPFMNWLMNLMHKVVGQWGVAIILMTLLLKVVTLPFTLAASRSAKRMQKLQPEMQALREKYKDNPQKQQKETMELFKKHKVNPMGGCLPIFITMPLFVAFFVMLQSTAELRFQGFLWAGDLSAPDTIWRIPFLGGIPLNIMPLLMGATMLIQMRMTPSPSVDNAQAKMMKFMPILFTFICYNFSCALALYSTINGIFTIGQQMVVNRMKDKEPAPAVANVSNTNRTIKNVTPVKKK